jgi:hypothetical protein
MDARSVVDTLFSKAQKVGQVVFVIIVIVWIVMKFTDHDQKVSPEVDGCYRSEKSPSITIESGKILINQDGMEEMTSSYRIDNVGPAIMTSKPLLLKPVAGGRYQFFVEDRAGRYMRFLPGPPKALEVTAADGMVISYSRVECGGALGTKTR